MAYVSGSTNSMTDLMAVIANIGEAAGYTKETITVGDPGFPLRTGVRITKGGFGVELKCDDGPWPLYPFRVFLQPYKISGTGGGSQGYKVFNPYENVNGIEFDWPINYEAYYYEEEVYIILRYQTDFFQFISFGDSKAPGNSECFWFSAPALTNTPENGTNASRMSFTVTTTNFTSVSSNNITPGIFCAQGSFWNSLTDSWCYTVGNAATDVRNHLGQACSSGLLWGNPSAFSSIAHLIPIKLMGASGTSGSWNILNTLKHCRLTRNDFYTAGEVVTLGAETWKIYPMYRKNAAVRNPGIGVLDSGTLAFAIRTNGD